MTIEAIRSRIFSQLFGCPVCGAAVLSAEKGDQLETVEFVCDAAFYLQKGSIIGVSKICPAPTHVAVRALERQAEAEAGKAVA